MINLTEQPINAADLLRDFEMVSVNEGAIVSFTGVVRPHSSSGRAVKSLLLQAHSPITETSIRKAAEIAHVRWPLLTSHVTHRVGHLRPGETIVFVSTASLHRRAAFEAANFLMDYLKTEAFFWKKEVTDEGAQWIEPCAKDYDDAARWTKA